VANLFFKLNKSLQYFIAIALVCFVASVCYLLSVYIGYKVVALILMVTVSLIAMFFDIAPVLISAILSALIWDFFFIPPRFKFRVSSAEDSLLLLMYFVIALVNASLTFKIRQIEKKASEKEEKENAIKLYNTLLNSLSHELQTPIATIIGATDTLRDSETKLSGENKNELVNEISIAALRLNEQVKNLLNMSRLESGFLQLKKDWCDINELIYSAVNKVQLKVCNRKIQITVPENFPLFKLDFGIMEQIIYNLLNNALQYTPCNSTISIAANYSTIVKGHFDVDENVSIVHRDSVSTKMTIVILDNGPGFPEKEINKVFDKFYRLDTSRTGGTGLGLSIVKGFIEAHNGTIELTNMLHGGARFKIEIPAEASYLNRLKNE
jgi:two-component system sensor histidine kinase KdpD